MKYFIEFEESDAITCCDTCRFCGYGQWNGDVVCLASEDLLYDTSKMPHTCPLQCKYNI